MKIGLEVRVDAWGRGQLQGRSVGAFQDSTDLKRRQDGEVVYKVVKQKAETSERLLL